MSFWVIFKKSSCWKAAGSGLMRDWQHRGEGQVSSGLPRLREAGHDTLTSLWNRGALMDLLGRELARSQREGISTIMRLKDVDHFKTVNDTHGHLVGDEVLCEIARRLLSYIRSYDFVGRYGGEEFLIVLNNCNPAFAESRAQEIRPGIPAGRSPRLPVH
jgi:diguanylate cyclase (GGDEF)-like protein